MRIRFRSSAAVLAGSALVVACSNLTEKQSSLPRDSGRTASVSQFLPARDAEPTGVNPLDGKFALLAVADNGNDDVELFNRKYQFQNSITRGLYGVFGDWYDDAGNLYVANTLGDTVTEYDTDDTLTHTYSAGLINPFNVATDRNENVYVVNGAGAQDLVVEYPQGSNTAIASCDTGLFNWGIAVSQNGAVFVTGQKNSTGRGNIVEYASGLSGCDSTTLGATLGDSGGMQIDKHNNLVVCDQGVGVDIIAPPYNAVSKTIFGAKIALNVALNKQNSLLFVTDYSSGKVLVDTYPAGTPVRKLGPANGISSAAGVAVYPFAK